MLDLPRNDLIKRTYEDWPDGLLSVEVTEKRYDRCGLPPAHHVEVRSTFEGDGDLWLEYFDDQLFIRMVAFSHQRRGYASSLLHYIAPYLREWNVDRLTCYPVTHEGKSWIEKHQFQPIPGVKGDFKTPNWERPVAELC
jgi:GNAT superfamily N-acetyltransferase